MEHYNLLEVSDHMLIDKIEDRDIFNEKSVIIDCGACVGNFTQPLFDKYKCDFYLYEPDPRNYRQLRYRFSTYKNVHLERAAIGTKIGKKKFYTGRFPTASSVFDSHRGLNGDEIYVDADCNVFGDKSVTITVKKAVEKLTKPKSAKPKSARPMSSK